MTNQIIQVFIERDGMTEAEAKEQLAIMRDQIQEDPDSAEDVLLENGLELDFIDDLIDLYEFV